MAFSELTFKLKRTMQVYTSDAPLHSTMIGTEAHTDLYVANEHNLISFWKVSCLMHEPHALSTIGCVLDGCSHVVTFPGGFHSHTSINPVLMMIFYPSSSRTIAFYHSDCSGLLLLHGITIARPFQNQRCTDSFDHGLCQATITITFDSSFHMSHSLLPTQQC